MLGIWLNIFVKVIRVNIKKVIIYKVIKILLINLCIYISFFF